MKLEAIKYFFRSPIIIGGCGRSGTSLLLSILSAHPCVVGIPEETTIFTLPRTFSSNILNRFNHYRRLVPYLLALENKSSARRWCEKTPRNVGLFKEINSELGGQVKLIHIIRDGRDVVTSSHPHYGDNYVSIDRWVRDVSLGLESRSLKNLYEVKYENLVVNFEKTIRGILDFLQEDFTPEICDFHKYTGVKRHLAYEDKYVKQLSQASVMKWKRPQHKPLIDEFYENAHAMALLEKLGYL